MITMLNIDCMEYMKTVPDKYFDLAIVDPPYSNNLKGGSSSRGECGWGNNFIDSKLHEWNVKPDESYFSLLKLKSRNQIIWGGNYFIEYLDSSPCIIIWDKGQRDFSLADGEMAWASFDSPLRIFNMSRAEANKLYRFHPTQKPVALYKWLLKNYAKPEMKILDTHGGSFSSAIACYDFGTVEYVGCELDKDYYDAAVKRFNYHKSQTNLFK